MNSKTFRSLRPLERNSPGQPKSGLDMPTLQPQPPSKLRPQPPCKLRPQPPSTLRPQPPPRLRQRPAPQQRPEEIEMKRVSKKAIIGFTVFFQPSLVIINTKLAFIC